MTMLPGLANVIGSREGRGGGPWGAFTWRTGARALALAAFCFLCNAFVQSDGIRATEAVVGLGWLALCYALSARCSVPRVLVLTFLGGIAWGLFIESQPPSDWLRVFERSARFSRGEFHAAFESKNSTTMVYGALFHLLFGSGWVTHYVASALAWTAGSALVYAAIVPFTGDERRARFVCFAIALCPTFLVFSPVLGSEGMFFLLSAVCAWLVSKHLRSTRWNPWLYGGLGLAFALLFLTRPTGVLLLGVCVPIIAATGPAVRGASSSPRFGRPGARAAGTVVAVAAVVLTLMGIAYELRGFGFQGLVHPTPWVYLQYGTNVAAGGQWNEGDVALNTEGTGRRNERTNRIAREIALKRLAAAGVLKSARFALTEKMHRLYGRDTTLFARAYGSSDRGEVLRELVQPAVKRVVAGAYRLVFLLFLALLVREVWRPSRLLVLGAVVLLYSLPHLLVEVYPRMHMPMLPYLAAGAALLVYPFGAGERGRGLGRFPWGRPSAS